MQAALLRKVPFQFQIGDLAFKNFRKDLLASKTKKKDILAAASKSLSLS